VGLNHNFRARFAAKTSSTTTTTRMPYRLAETSIVEAEVEVVPVDGVSIVTSDVRLSRGLLSLPSRDAGTST